MGKRKQRNRNKQVTANGQEKVTERVEDKHTNETKDTGME